MPTKPFTGVQPMVRTTRGFVACEPHHADVWMPILNGRPIVVRGKALNYPKKKQAIEALGTALLRRQPLPRAYKLGKRMAPREGAN